jgi:hypothetical protein
MPLDPLQTRKSHSIYRRFMAAPVDIPGTAKTPVDLTDVFPITSRLAVEVVAVDTNYYQYYRTPGDPFTAAPPSRLTGGLGVFGSIVPVYARQFEVR